MQGNAAIYVLIIYREMDVDLITLADLTAAASAPGIVEPIPNLGATSGVTTTPIPLSGVLQAADQNAQFLLALRRNIDTGTMDLVSFRKGRVYIINKTRATLQGTSGLISHRLTSSVAHRSKPR